MSPKLDKALLQKFVEKLSTKLFSLYKIRPKLGAEVEFYLTGADEEIPKVFKVLSEQGIIVENEKGKNQYECVLEYSDNLQQLIAQINHLRDLIQSSASKHSLKAIFDAKPFADDYGSALHLHLSLHDAGDNNVYAKGGIGDNIFMQRSIAGILELTAEGLHIICNRDQDYLRYCPQFMAPTKLSWGGNNRTTVIRIPDSKPAHRRIEYRLAPAHCDPMRLIYLMLLGAYHGLQNELVPPPRIYGNAFDEQYLLEELPANAREAKNIFHNRGNIAKYIHEAFQES